MDHELLRPGMCTSVSCYCGYKRHRVLRAMRCYLSIDIYTPCPRNMAPCCLKPAAWNTFVWICLN